MTQQDLELVESIDFQVLKAAVKTILEDVAGVGKIETRVGGTPTWVERARPKQAFWELSVPAAPEQEYAAGNSVWEDCLVRIEGVSPFSYEDRTENDWDSLLRAMKTALRSNPLLVIDGIPLLSTRWANFGIPSLTVNDFVTFEDGQKGVRCHHAVIEVRYRNDFDFEAERE